MADKTFDTTVLEGNYSLRDVYNPSNNPVVNVSRASVIGTPFQEGKIELIQKHNKHINDLKTYYGRELERLNERIRSLEQFRPAITDALQQSRQDDSKMVGQLEEQLKSTRSQLTDHVTQLGVANKMVSVLQEQLVVARKEQGEMKSELIQLREENNILHESLKDMQQELEDSKASQIERMGQLLSELEHTQQEYQRVKELNEQVTEERLKTHREHSTMSAMLAKMEQQRQDDQSTIQSLQDEIRRIQLMTNRSHNMSTHHSLANDYSSPQSAVTVRTSPHYRTSPIKIRGSPSPPSRAMPLTRRKWLEQSDASLISGVGHASHDHNSPPGHVSLDDTLKAVRTGDVTSYGPNKRRLEERVKANLEEVATAQEDFARLQEQRKQLEATLQRIPTTGRVTMEMKQKRLNTEEQLDRVVKEIGMVRMLLRSHHALKITT